MSGASAGAVSVARYDAVLFDLDGVVTDTASVHSAAWKEMFDTYLEQRARREGTDFVPFSEDDYLDRVDGKPRYDGVRDFLASRGVTLPEGTPDSPPDEESVCGLGNRKNQLVRARIKRDGVHVFGGTVDWIHQLRDDGIRTAIVSSSRDCALVLEAAGLTDLFDVRVDGIVGAQLSLPGKPAPDTYLEAARRLHVPSKRSVVVEDALAGVEVGKGGDFGLVVGVNRTGIREELLAHGADLVVDDLAEMLR